MVLVEILLDPIKDNRIQLLVNGLGILALLLIQVLLVAIALLDIAREDFFAFLFVLLGQFALLLI